MSVTLDAEVQNAWNRLTADGNSISWVLFGYPEASTNTLEFKSEGEGGMPEFMASLPEGDVAWGAFKVVGVDDRGNTVSRRPKYIMVKWAPAGAKTMRKARVGGHKGAVKEVMNSHLDIEIEAKEELTEEDLVQRLKMAGGAHTPTSFEFSNYSS